MRTRRGLSIHIFVDQLQQLDELRKLDERFIGLSRNRLICDALAEWTANGAPLDELIARHREERRAGTTEAKKELITVYIEDALIEKLAALATFDNRHKHLSRATQVRAAIDDWLARHARGRSLLSE